MKEVETAGEGYQRGITLAAATTTVSIMDVELIAIGLLTGPR